MTLLSLFSNLEAGSPIQNDLFESFRNTTLLPPPAQNSHSRQLLNGFDPGMGRIRPLTDSSDEGVFTYGSPPDPNSMFQSAESKSFESVLEPAFPQDPTSLDRLDWMLLGDQYRKYVEKLKGERKELVKAHNLEMDHLHGELGQKVTGEDTFEKLIHAMLSFESEMKSRLPLSDRLGIAGLNVCSQEGCIFRTYDRETLQYHSREGRHYTLLPHYLDPARNRSYHDPSLNYMSLKETIMSSDRSLTSALSGAENQRRLQDLEATNVFSPEIEAAQTERVMSQRPKLDSISTVPETLQITIPQPDKQQSSVSENKTASLLSRTQSQSPQLGSTKKQRLLKEPAKFKCSECPKRFTRASTLRDHARTHNGERPFVCSICGKAFVRLKDKKRHEDLHSGAKDFVCKFSSGHRDGGCGRKFVREDGLIAHFRTEAGWACITTGLFADGVNFSSDSGTACKSAIQNMAASFGIIHDTQSRGCDEAFIDADDLMMEHIVTDHGKECWRPLLIRIALRLAKRERDKRVQTEEQTGEPGKDAAESPLTDHRIIAENEQTDDSPINSPENTEFVEAVQIFSFSPPFGREGDSFRIVIALAKGVELFYDVIFKYATADSALLSSRLMNVEEDNAMSNSYVRVRVPAFADTLSHTRVVPVALRACYSYGKFFQVKDIPVGSFTYVDTPSCHMES